MSKRNCSVVGCSNTYAKCKNRSTALHLYSFPSKPWESERRTKWIQFVRRKNRDGSDWIPTKNSRVCSDHFISGKKSEHPQNPDYVPTVSDNKNSESNYKTQRFQRLQNRNSNHETQKTKMQAQDDSVMPIETEDCEGESSMVLTTTITELPPSPKIQRSISCGPDTVQSLFNFRTITCEARLISLAGVTFRIFGILLRLIEGYKPKCLTIEDHLFLTLMRLKLGINSSAIASFFELHPSTPVRIFTKILELIYKRAVRSNKLIPWLSKQAVQATMPECFKQIYPNTRVVIDCSEIYTERPSTIRKRNYLYSKYKHGYTCKFLIGMAPSGLITFLSRTFNGRASDTYITNHCGLLKLVEKYDDVMSDKGFPQIRIQDVTLVIPPRKSAKQKKFTEEQAAETHKIASVRIHVERVIQRMKQFDILNKVLPAELQSHINEILYLCAVITNLSSPIIKQ